MFTMFALAKAITAPFWTWRRFIGPGSGDALSKCSLILQRGAGETLLGKAKKRGSGEASYFFAFRLSVAARRPGA